jgi:undecaprenyl-diphosphatase
VSVVGRLLGADASLAARLNLAAREAAMLRAVVSGAATWLAGVEVLLMLVLAVAGRKRQAARMLVAVSVVYVASEGLSLMWSRKRPFAELVAVEPLVAHEQERSFPSRHVASGLAMAVIGSRVRPRLGAAMTGVAWLLGLSRIAAGLHYPSDVLAGALLGTTIGRLLR